MVYNDVAGRDVGRLAALSDGIFAFAFTVLVLDIRVPDVANIHSEAELWHALTELGPQLITVLMTFLTLGIFWVGQQTQLSHLKSADRNMVWIHIVFLFAVVAEPFSTKLLSAFIAYRVALLVYWFNIVVLGFVAYMAWTYAGNADLLDEDAALPRKAVERRSSRRKRCMHVVRRSARSARTSALQPSFSCS
jgi:uncharacterized membrane protein